MASRDLSVGVNLIGRDVSASKALNQLGIKAKSTGDVLASMSKKASYAIAAVGTAAVTAAKAAMEDQAAAANLANTLKNVINANDKTVASIEDYISKTTLASSISDDQLRPAFGKLITATKSVTKAQNLLTTAMDIGIKYQIDTETAAKAVVKAYNGNFTALGRLTGIAFPKGKKEAISFADGMKKVENVVGGSLNAYLETTAGKFAKSTNAIKEAQESLGYALIPYMEKLANLLNKLTPWLEKNQNEILKWGKVILGVAVAIKVVNGAFIMFQALQGVAALGGIAAGWIGIGNAATVAGTRVASAGVIASAGWGWLIGIIASVAALGYFANKAYKNRNMKVDRGKKGTILNPNDIPAWNSGMLGKNMSLPTFSSLYSRVPKTATGGIVTGPQIRMVGEAGPEAIIPLNKSGMFGQGITINVAGSVIREKDLAITVRDNIAQLMRRRGINPSPILGV